MIWNKIIDVLSKAKLVTTRVCKLSELLVHPRNRSGLGVNAFNAHANLAVIKAVGADRKELKKATAFELCPLGDTQQAQLAFNHRLVEQSDGLLSPVCGSERLLTVACSHTVAGFRAVAAFKWL